MRLLFICFNALFMLGTGQKKKKKKKAKTSLRFQPMGQFG